MPYKYKLGATDWARVIYLLTSLARYLPVFLASHEAQELRLPVRRAWCEQAQELLEKLSPQPVK